MFSYHQTKGKPLKLWDGAGPFEEQAMEQLRKTAELPFIHKHIAGMPDVHLGKGSTIGSVIPTKRAIVPAAVGVDIGCGMVAQRTSLTASDLPDNLHALRSMIEAAVPKGFETSQAAGHVKGGWDSAPAPVLGAWRNRLQDRYEAIVAKYPMVAGRSHIQLGSMGGGNHFIEICVDEEDRVWAMLHSGSRGSGNRIGSHFIAAAQAEMQRWHIDVYLPDQDLAYLVENTALFDDYIEAMNWAQDYAMINRELMLDAVLRCMRSMLPAFTTEQVAINCHHNYATKEAHFGENVWVTRKGAVRARAGDLGIIPGSMGTGSFIVEGLGNPESFNSCSHGAGRRMPRNKAREQITHEQHIAAMVGIEGRTDVGVIDESPAAYKSIESVMAAQTDLVKPLYHLRQVLNVKG